MISAQRRFIMDAKHIGLFLLQQRKKNTLTQRDVALICNVSAQAVSKWERGESIPDIEALEKLSLLYKVSINELISGEKEDSTINTELRKRILSLILSILVFVIYLLPYVSVTTNDRFLGINDIGTVLQGYEVVFNGTGGIFVTLAIIVFIILLTHLLLSILLLLEIFKKSTFVGNYITFSSSIIILISFSHLFVPGFFKMPQVLFIFLMISQILLLIDNVKVIKRYFISFPQMFQHVQKNWKTIISKSIYYLSVGTGIVVSYLLVQWNILENQDFKVIENIPALIVILLIILSIVMLFKFYPTVFNQSNTHKILPLLIVLLVPFVFITATLIWDIVFNYNEFETEQLPSILLAILISLIIPINVYVSTKYVN
jgi:transcriptional regulator with XRE-family HTH domain